MSLTGFNWGCLRLAAKRKGILWILVVEACKFSLQPLLAAELQIDVADRVANRLAPAMPFPALKEAARANSIPLEQIDSPKAATNLNVGDSFTALVTLHERGSRSTQWLLYLEVVAPSSKERAARPPPSMTLYSSCGTKLEFVSRPAFVSLRTIGPFVEQGRARKPLRVHDESARFQVNEGFLALGLDQNAAVSLRLRESNVKRAFWFSPKPILEAEVAKGRELAERVQLTPAEERALAGSFPALLSYIEIVQETSGLEDIFFKLVDKPSIWSVLWHGVTMNIRLESDRVARADAAKSGLPAGAQGYYVPLGFEINRHHALNVTFVVMSPRPPFLACGGIVVMLAEKPDDKETHLTLQVVSARCARD